MFAVNSVPDMPKVTVTTFIEEDLKAKLKELADIERRSVSQMIAVLIERGIQDAESRGIIPSAKPTKSGK